MHLASDRIYLDNNATTRIDPRVAASMSQLIAPEQLHALGYNPASQHQEGRTARRWVEESRDAILSLLGGRTAGMDSDRLIWTSGGTEANNLALFGLMSHYPGALIVSAIEHPSVLEAAKVIASRQPQTVRILPVDPAGTICLNTLEKWLKQGAETGQPISLVSLMLANNETGVIQPIASAIAIAHRYGALVHCDAVQAVGKVPVSFSQLDVDALTLTAHKIHGPIGIGALLMRGSIQIDPQLFGGFQQLGLRPGTESPLLTAAFHRALSLMIEQQEAASLRMALLRNRLEEGLLGQLPDVVIHGQRSPRLPHTSSIGFPGCDRQALQMALDMVGVACSTGSACASGSSQPSHVLAAMQVTDDLLQSSIRLSLSRMTTEIEIDQAIVRIAEVVKKSHQRRTFNLFPTVSTI